MSTQLPAVEKKKFLDRRIAECELFKDFISNNNSEGYSRLCHQLKGSLKMWGFLNLSEVAAQTIFKYMPLNDDGIQRKSLLNQELEIYHSALKNELKQVIISP